MRNQAIANAIMTVLAVGFWTTGLVAGPLFASTASGCFLTILLIVVICVVVISSRIDVVAGVAIAHSHSPLTLVQQAHTMLLLSS